MKAKDNPNVYVSGLPPDVTVQELEPLFKRAGVLKVDVETGGSKIRIYCDESGRCKGDALVSYANSGSVDLAVKFLHEHELRTGCTLCVQQADFEDEKKDVHLSKDQLKEMAVLKKDASRKRYLAAKNMTKEAVSWSGEMDDGTGRRIVVLRHMFSAQEAEKEGPEFYKELAEEVKTECEKVGQVARVTPMERHKQGIVCVKFKSSSEAEECIRVMDGRFFGGHTVEACFYDGKTDLRALGVAAAPPAKSAASLAASPQAVAVNTATAIEPTGPLEASAAIDESSGPAEGPRPSEQATAEAAVDGPPEGTGYNEMFEEDSSSDDEEFKVRTE
ncbi:unnamed protein product [Polarella glacialis]|nr:unnamed protein product [Polarella glacialis]